MFYTTGPMTIYTNDSITILFNDLRSTKNGSVRLMIQVREGRLSFCLFKNPIFELLRIDCNSRLIQLLKETPQLTDENTTSDNVNIIHNILDDAIKYAYSREYGTDMSFRHTLHQMCDYNGVKLVNNEVYIFRRKVNVNPSFMNGFDYKKKDHILIEFLHNIVDAPRNIPAKR